MPLLKQGDRVTLQDGQAAEVLDFIAEGGQGEVYRVRYNGSDHALKWYSKHAPTEAFYKNLESNVLRGSPKETFLWPLAVSRKVNGRFGYVMPLRPPRFREYGDFLLGQARFPSWDALFTAAISIADSYTALHSIGYSYQDLNEGGFFIDPETSEVLICDNDNVAPDGVNLGVRGTPKYMAPEVVRGEVRPSTWTDLFSLAVVISRLFLIDHPLEGRHTIRYPLTDENGAVLFGKHPVFVYDPKDDSNRPTPDAQPNIIERWPLLPPDLLGAFTRSFTTGLQDVNARLTGPGWRNTLLKARAMLVSIGGREQFVNAYNLGGLPSDCVVLRTDEQRIALAPGSRLYECQVDSRSMDHKKEVGIVARGKKNRNTLGLGNLGYTPWAYTLPDGREGVAGHKGVIPLTSGTRVDFGSIQGVVL